MLTYTTVPDFEAYMGPGWATDNATELTKVLEMAENYVDEYLGFYAILDNGRKFDVSPATDLTDVQVSSLNRGTCAQAKYIMHMGPVFFTEQSQYSEVTGGDIETSKPNIFGPEMKIELRHIPRALTGRLV